MELVPIDLIELAAVVMGVSVVLIPVIGLTARFALEPTMKALSKFFDVRGHEEVISLLERRMALLEQQVEIVEGSVRRLGDERDFDRQLGSGAPPSSDS